LEIFLSIAYLLLFLWLISRLSFFRLTGIPPVWISGVFVLKVVCGVVFWYVYTFYYKIRSEADIYKYFDDSEIMFDALRHHPADFLKMVFGFDSTAHFQDLYYSKMQVWSPRFENSFNFENHTMVRLNALFRLFSCGYYQVHSVFINLLSFAGLTALYKTFEVYAERKKKLLFLSICLGPIVLFWGSGVIKESFILFAMGFAIYYLHQLLCPDKTSSRKVKGLCYCLLSISFLFLLATIKLALAVFVLMGCTAWYMSFKITIWPVVINFILVILLVFAGTVLLAGFTSHDYFKTLVTKQSNYINISNGGVFLEGHGKIIFISYDKRKQVLEQITDSVYKLRRGSSYFYYNIPKWTDTIYVKGSEDTLYYHLYSMAVPVKQSIQIPILSASPLSFIKSAPTAFMNALTRPFIGESKNTLVLFMAIQNAIFLLLLLLSLFFTNKVIFQEPAFWFCVLVVAGYYVLFGWLTPILGALMRYKTPVFPLFMIILVLLFDKFPKRAV